MQRFDYSAIPAGYYDDVLRKGSPIRRAWHLQKFQRVAACFPNMAGKRILDIGCFAGSFLSLLSSKQFSYQLGVDILPDQIDIAQKRYGTPFREFKIIENLEALHAFKKNPFDCITAIELIEHLTENEISVLFKHISGALKSRGRFVFSTPNYTSSWPAVEILINRFSDVKYHEQHIVKFNYFSLFDRLKKIYPPLEYEFEVELKTTTHFITPFLAPFLTPRASGFFSQKIRPSHWRLPFGNLVLASLIRKPKKKVFRATLKPEKWSKNAIGFGLDRDLIPLVANKASHHTNTNHPL